MKTKTPVDTPQESGSDDSATLPLRQAESLVGAEIRRFTAQPMVSRCHRLCDEAGVSHVRTDETTSGGISSRNALRFLLVLVVALCCLVPGGESRFITPYRNRVNAMRTPFERLFVDRRSGDTTANQGGGDTSGNQGGGDTSVNQGGDDTTANKSVKARPVRCEISDAQHLDYGRQAASGTTMLLPPERVALRQLQSQMQQEENSIFLTDNKSSCRSIPMDPTLPLHERSVCRYRYKINFDEARVPRAVTEVKCECAEVQDELVPSRVFKCEPLIYRLKVVRYDPTCAETPVETFEEFTLGCVPTIKISGVSAHGHTTLATPVKPFYDY